MTLKTRRSSGGAIVSSLSLPTHSEHCISISGSDSLKLDSIAAETLKELSAEPLARFVFAGVKGFPSFQANALPSSCGLTWLQGDACKDGETTAMQVFAVSGLHLTPIERNGQRLGFVYEDENARYCRLCGVAPQSLSASGFVQTTEVFETLASCLGQHSFKFTDTVRTWLYLDNLLSWYKEFNTARTAFFEREGVFSKMVPASTGIGAKNQHGAALVCDLLAVQPKNPAVKIQSIESPLQGSALSYKSSFSRAVEMAFPTHRSIMISGTASIDPEGRSVNLGDTAKQIDLTMRVVQAILESRGMGWADVSRGIAYFKDFKEAHLLDAYCKEHGIPELSLAYAHTDICRDDLLFETEIDALKA